MSAPPVTPAPEVNKITATKPVTNQPSSQSTYGVTLGSIKNVKGNAKDRIGAKDNSISKIEMNADNLNEAWIKKSEDIAANRPFLKSSLADSDIGFVNQAITIRSTHVAYEHLKSIRMDLLSYFKTVYHNDEINVMVEEKKPTLNDEGSQKMSMKEVFEKMSQKNPILKQLKDKFGMDFEY